MDENTSSNSGGINFFGAIKAGFVASIVMTLVMFFLGTDMTKGLGVMLVGASAGTMKVYLAGAAMHLLIGVVFGILYAVLIAPMTSIGRLVKAILYGTLLTAAAYYSMPVVVAKIGEYRGSQNPCAAYNPCNPCAANPCTLNPCNPCAAKFNPCNPCAYNPCNPCNPCADGGSAAILESWVNHFVYALVIALVYRPRRN